MATRQASYLVFFFLMLLGAPVMQGAGLEADEIVFSTYLGGELTDVVQAIAVDGIDRVYFVGTTQSTAFPDAGRAANHGVDAFLGRLSADGRALEYLFWFNAINAADVDEGFGIALDAQGSAIVTGHTRSPDFCTLFGDVPGYDSSYNGNGDAFVLKVTPDGSRLVYCTFLGGNDWDSGTAVAVDSEGNVTLTGGTWSADFPTTAGAVASEPYGLRDAFLARLDASGALAYATYFGGSGQEQGAAISVNEERTIITGWTNSTDMQVTADALSGQNKGSFDAFLMILDGDQQLAYATYVGGNGEDRGAAVATGPGSLVYVGGSTRSAGFLIGDLENSTWMDTDERRLVLDLNGFVAGLIPGEGQARYTTFLGGAADDRVTGVAVDSFGSVFATGDTRSADFSTSDGGEIKGEQDSFLVLVGATGSLRYSTLLGGSDWERGEAVVLGSEGNVYLGGATRSADFPTTPGAYDTSLNDDYDAYISHLLVATNMLEYRMFLPVAKSD